MARMELVVVALGLLLDLCQGFGVPLARGAAWAPSRGALAIRPSRGIGAGSRSSSPSQRLQTAAHAGGGGGSSTWWEERGELPFECTGCGKCCRVQGDVWVDPEEASSLAEHLSLSLDDFVKQYTSRSAQGWVQLLDRGEDHACIFLGEDNKTCSVYEARPLQCRVYPFFPRLLSSPEAWNAEVVTADDEGGSGEWGGGQREWTPETGGCEGMREVKDVRFNKKKGVWKAKAREPEEAVEAPPKTVSAAEVREQVEAYESYFLGFPHEFLLSNQRRASSSTPADELLQAFGQAPGGGGAGDGRPELFYDQIFAVSNLVERELAKDRDEGGSEAVAPPPGDAEGGGGSGGEEVLGAGYVSGRRGDGGDVSEEERSIVGLVSDWAERHVIRLGLCPFAKPAMETGKVRFKIASGLVDVDSACRLLLQEADLVMQTSEEVLPTTLIAFPDLFPDNFLEWNTFVESIEDNLDQGGGWEEVGEHVLIAAFHPGFEFGGLEEAERVLNFEKRAPVPVINLLRTEAIDRGIERGVTAEKIAEDNEEALLNEGLEDVKRVYEDLGDKEA